LLVSAVVEARSCERFYRLQPYLPGSLSDFYARLLASEARHYQLYLDLAAGYATQPYTAKLQQILEIDAVAVTELDTQLRFHSGPLAES
jgi:tRNA-(ms[2]io[6]A)-hydroxylase